MRRASLTAAALVTALLLGPLPAGAAGRVLKDGVGRDVKVPEDPRRIVSLAPNITEILFTIGAGDRVVGVTDYCRYPLEGAAPASIGGFVNPSLEVVVSLKPDLVIATADGNRPIDILLMAKTGISVYVIDTRSIKDIYDSIKTIGLLTGLDEPAREVVTRMESSYYALKERVADRPKPTVLYLLGLNPMIGVGPGTFLHHLIEEAGGVNVLAGSMVKYPLISMENLLAADPEVIIMNAVEGMDEVSVPGLLEKMAGWEQLRAGTLGRVHLLEDESILQPGPRIMEALELLISLFHPLAESESVEPSPLEDEEVETAPSEDGDAEPSFHIDVGVEP